MLGADRGSQLHRSTHSYDSVSLAELAIGPHGERRECGADAEFDPVRKFADTLRELEFTAVVVRMMTLAWRG